MRYTIKASRLGWVLAALLLCLPVAVFAQGQQTATIRALWNNEVFVLINTSRVGVDVTNLVFESSRGAITPEAWEAGVNEVGEVYDLTDVRPGSCLLAYYGGSRPALPDGVTCTRIVAEATLININDVVWDVSQGGFTPLVNGVPGEDCSIQRTSCELEVPTGEASIEVGGQVLPETVEVRAVWSLEMLTLINVSDFGADLSELSLVSEDGIIAPDDWVPVDGRLDLDDVRPGGCLLAYLGGVSERPDLPLDVDCTRVIAEFTPENLDDLVWSLDQNGFRAVVGDSVAATCTITGTTTCDIPVPNADIDREDEAIDEAEAQTDATVPSVRAIWNEDTLVLINTSTSGLDLSSLEIGPLSRESFALEQAPTGEFPFTLENLRPGSCLQVYEGETAPALPTGVNCTRVIGAAQVNAPFWLASQGSFDANDTTCSTTTGTTCDIPTPAVP